MLEQNTPNEPETIFSLSRSLIQLIDSVDRNQRHSELQQQAQQTQIDALFEGQRSQQTQISTVAQAVQDLVICQREVIIRMDEMQSEVYNLQTESPYLFDLFLNQQEPPDESN